MQSNSGPIRTPSSVITHYLSIRGYSSYQEVFEALRNNNNEVKLTDEFYLTFEAKAAGMVVKSRLTGEQHFVCPISGCKNYTYGFNFCPDHFKVHQYVNCTTSLQNVSAQRSRHASVVVEPRVNEWAPDVSEIIRKAEVMIGKIYACLDVKTPDNSREFHAKIYQEKFLEIPQLDAVITVQEKGSNSLQIVKRSSGDQGFFVCAYIQEREDKSFEVCRQVGVKRSFKNYFCNAHYSSINHTTPYDYRERLVMCMDKLIRSIYERDPSIREEFSSSLSARWLEAMKCIYSSHDHTLEFKFVDSVMRLIINDQLQFRPKMGLQRAGTGHPICIYPYCLHSKVKPVREFTGNLCPVHFEVCSKVGAFDVEQITTPRKSNCALPDIFNMTNG